MNQSRLSRRQWLTSASAGLGAAGLPDVLRARAPGETGKKQAQIAITLDLEMSRNFPTWEATHWDYEKGNLDAATKAYAVEAARRVKEHGGRIHFFVVGRVFEQEDVGWLKQLAEDGHPIGNHTYDHVNVRATRAEDLQFRFQRSPWLIEGQSPSEVVRENIRLTNAALKARLGLAPNGFRTPGGFTQGLTDREDLQALLLDLGFRWVSSKYPAHPNSLEGQEPSDSVVGKIVAAQREAQPFRYPSGLVEVPMSPISDIGAFRTSRWKLAWFVRTIQAAAKWCIEQRAVFDFLGHPSCLTVTDPNFQTIEAICELVKESGERAKFTTLDKIAQSVQEDAKGVPDAGSHPYNG